MAVHPASATPLKINATQFKSLIQRSFSPLPYSVFRCDLSGVPTGLKFKQVLGKYSWRNTLVSLRAPKHFKVGRQHYSKPSRVVQLCLYRTSTTAWVVPSGPVRVLTMQAALTRAEAFASQTALQQPMATVKQVSISFSAKITLPVIV